MVSEEDLSKRNVIKMKRLVPFGGFGLSGSKQDGGFVMGGDAVVLE